MQFSMSENIHALKGKLHTQSFPILSSTPGKDLINPGFAYNLYTDIVPLNSGHTTEHKIFAKDNEILESQTVENQTGSGLSKEQIQYSFQHPRPIKTETLILNKTATKRQHESEQSFEDNKDNKMKSSKKLNFFPSPDIH